MRGTAAGEPVVSQANTREFDEGYERVFGVVEPKRGRWVWDSTKGELVSAEDYREPERALDAPIMSGRFYEGVQIEGRDVGSRARYRDYLKETGTTSASDYSREHWKKVEEQRARMRAGDFDHKARREAVERAVHDVFQKGKRPTRRYEDDPL